MPLPTFQPSHQLTWAAESGADRDMRFWIRPPSFGIFYSGHIVLPHFYQGLRAFLVSRAKFAEMTVVKRRGWRDLPKETRVTPMFPVNYFLPQTLSLGDHWREQITFSSTTKVFFNTDYIELLFARYKRFNRKNMIENTFWSFYLLSRKMIKNVC